MSNLGNFGQNKEAIQVPNIQGGANNGGVLNNKEIIIPHTLLGLVCS